MFCNIKKFLVTERNFLSQEEEIYFTVKKYLPEEIVWPKTFLFNWKSIKSIYPLYLLWLDGGGVWISHIFPNLNYFAIILQYYLYKKCLHFKFFPISVEGGGGHRKSNFSQIQNSPHYQENYGLFPQSVTFHVWKAPLSWTLST